MHGLVIDTVNITIRRFKPGNEKVWFGLVLCPLCLRLTINSVSYCVLGVLCTVRRLERGIIVCT